MNRKTRVAFLSLVVGVVLNSACTSSADDVGTTSSSGVVTTASTATTTTTTTVPVSTTLSDAELWDQIPGWSGVIFGEVRSINFDPAFKFVVEEGDGVVCLPHPDLDGWTSVGVNAGDLDSGLLITRREPTTVDDTVSELVAALTDPTEREPMAIGGAEGVMFQGSPSPDAGTYHDGPSCTWTFSRGELWRYWVVDVNGSVVTFGLYGPAQDFDIRITEAEDLLATIEWRDFP